MRSPRRCAAAMTAQGAEPRRSPAAPHAGTARAGYGNRARDRPRAARGRAARFPRRIHAALRLRAAGGRPAGRDARGRSHRRGRARGHRRQSRRPRSEREPVAPRPGSTAGATCRSSSAPRSRRRRRSRARPSSSSPIRRRSSSPAGRPRASPTARSASRGTSRARRPAVDAGRADPAQLELFNHRFMQVAEQMGAVLQATAVSVNIRERLDFSCAVFDADGRAHRERAAHAGSPRVDGRERACSHRGEPGLGSGDVSRLDAERTLRRRHPPAGHHGRDPGLHGGRPGSVLLRRLARPPRRHRRHHAGIDAAGLAHDRGGRRRVRQFPAAWTTARSAKRRCATASPADRGRRAIPTRTSPISRRSSRQTRAAPPSSGRSSAAPDTTRWCATWGTSRTTPRPACAKSIGRLGDGHLRYEMDDGSADRGAGPRRSARRGAPSSTSPAPGAAAGKLQRAARGLHRGRALRVPHAGRRRVPAERGLPAPALDPGGTWLDGQSGAARGRRRRQRGDVAVHRRRAVRRARRARGVARAR